MTNEKCLAREQDQYESAVRIRDNQRRSRARRKSYVENLERKLKEYERRAVEATLEMQHAARTVDVENSRLKMMLTSLGVSEHDVDSFLTRCKDSRATEALQSVGMRSVHHNRKGNEARDVNTEKQDVSNGEASGPQESETSSCMPSVQRHASIGGHIECILRCSDASNIFTRDAPLPVQASANFQSRSRCESKTLCITAASEATSSSIVNTSKRAVTATSANIPTSLPAAASVVQESSSPMEMSCNAAAAIIAEMQGHGDTNAAKALLGCRAQEDCLVKNTLLFQILEDEMDGNFSGRISPCENIEKGHERGQC